MDRAVLKLRIDAASHGDLYLFGQQIYQTIQMPPSGPYQRSWAQKSALLASQAIADATNTQKETGPARSCWRPCANRMESS